MCLYNDDKLEVQTYNTYYPSPHSPSKDKNEWIMSATPLDHNVYYENTNHLQQYFEASESPASCSSSMGVNTPDVGFFDITNSFMLSNRPSFEYACLLNQHSPMVESSIGGSPNGNHYTSSIYFPVKDDSKELIPSLSDEERVILQQKEYSGSFESYQPYQNYTCLNQLTKEQLIQRVVALEKEKNGTASKLSKPCSISIAGPIVTESKETSVQMYSCKWVACEAQAPTLDKLMTHICNSHVGSGKTTYHCEWQDCPRDKKPFMKRHKMHNHMRTHTGERPFVCTVAGCSKTFSRPDSLSTHIKTHSENRPYLCSMSGCEKAYYHSRSLRKHIKSSHMKYSKSNTIPSPSSVQPAFHHYHLQNRINTMKKSTN